MEMRHLSRDRSLTLVVMAAGMGSRYGGLKQIDPVSDNGEIIMDFSVYDAIRAGFNRIIFVIKREFAEDFERITAKWSGSELEIDYAFQDLADLPQGFEVPEGRVKPWGTGHAVLAARSFIDGDFVVINADDFYGASSFQLVAEYLRGNSSVSQGDFCMAAYNVESTLTENGTVSRGVCAVDSAGFLRSIVERTRIYRNDNGEIVYEENETECALPEGTPVSMNFWGFRKSFMCRLENDFMSFLKDKMPADPLCAEFYLPACVGNLVEKGEADVKVLLSGEKWFGVTYKEDKEAVSAALRTKKKIGIYPEKLAGR